MKTVPSQVCVPIIFSRELCAPPTPLVLTDRLAVMFAALPEADRSEVIDLIVLKRMPEIRECVDPILFLASEQSSYITGAVLDVNGGRLMAN